MRRRIRSQPLKPLIDPVRTGTESGNLRCRSCGKPDGVVVRVTADGRWYDWAGEVWRDDRGRAAPWPDIVEYAGTTDVAVRVTPLRFPDAPAGRVRLLCDRCRRTEGRVRQRARVRLSALMRRAVGDLFLGRYDDPEILDRVAALFRKR